MEEEEGSGQMHSVSGPPSLFGHSKLINIQPLSSTARSVLLYSMKAGDILIKRIIHVHHYQANGNLN